MYYKKISTWRKLRFRRTARCAAPPDFRFHEAHNPTRGSTLPSLQAHCLQLADSHAGMVDSKINQEITCIYLYPVVPGVKELAHDGRIQQEQISVLLLERGTSRCFFMNFITSPWYISLIRGIAAALRFMVAPGGLLQLLWRLSRDGWGTREGIGKSPEFGNEKDASHTSPQRSIEVQGHNVFEGRLHSSDDNAEKHPA
ncbi:hypothetical protein C8J57DRAFT_1459656 [Mycena rebaudengoi]|nr:hypothetical protein C8J57DRAFT_1459656 [Mycena rebaudengoi]